MHALHSGGFRAETEFFPPRRKVYATLRISMSSARQEARRFLLPLYAVDLLLFASLFILYPGLLPWTGMLFAVFVVLTLFVTYFFRDPVRAVPADPDLIVSAADGTVVTVEEMEEPDFHLGPMKRVAVFLSVFDVHVNRSPVDSSVKSTVYRAGKFLDARHLEASTRNECRSWWLETPRGPVAVRQIAGLIARRIVAWSGDGASLTRGQHLGMIRFGSRTEVFVPLECTILVKPGDRVRGASTPIARWPAN
jgi:phosphatidylserine decarboxylase